MLDGMGATIMGRNMFGPVRGDWGDSDWTGWWGDEPPYHCPVFVLTHHARDPIALKGTTFHFVTDGVEVAYARAVDAAGTGPSASRAAPPAHGRRSMLGSSTRSTSR